MPPVFCFLRWVIAGALLLLGPFVVRAGEQADGAPAAQELRRDGVLRVRVAGLERDPLLRARVASEARAAWLAALAWFGRDLEGEVEVRWTSSPLEMRRYGLGGPSSIAALALPEQNRIVLFGPALRPYPGRVRPVLLHEFCHLFFHRMTAGAEVIPPRWLNEGIAMWRSGEWDLPRPWRVAQARLLRDAAAAGSLLRLSELDAAFPGEPFFALAYAQSLSFLEWMLAQGGEEGLRGYLELLDRDLDPKPAFARVYGMDLAAAEEKWRRSLRGPGWLRVLPSARTLLAAAWVALGLLVAAKFVAVRLRLRRMDDPGEP